MPEEDTVFHTAYTQMDNTNTHGGGGIYDKQKGKHQKKDEKKIQYETKS